MKPNFIYIGPDKAGSSWLFKLFSWHSDIYVTPAKDIYFFDRYYHRGLEWYLHHFSLATDDVKVVAEISHDYLYSEEALERIAETFPNARLMVCLREPVDRAFSAYLYLLKHGLYKGSFEEAISEVPELKEHGKYYTYLLNCLKYFNHEQMYVAVFDDLKENSSGFATKLFRFLEVADLEIPESLLEKTLPASRSRFLFLSKIIKRVALLIREMGFGTVVGKIKSSPLVQKILYKPYSSKDKPVPDQQTVEKLRVYYKGEIEKLDELLGTNFIDLWGYKEVQNNELDSEVLVF